MSVPPKPEVDLVFRGHSEMQLRGTSINGFLNLESVEDEEIIY